MPWYAASTAIATSDKYKNEEGCRDDTMPKIVDTRRHCEVGLRACNRLPQTPQQRCREGVAEDCSKTEWTGLVFCGLEAGTPFFANISYLSL